MFSRVIIITLSCLDNGCTTVLTKGINHFYLYYFIKMCLSCYGETLKKWRMERGAIWRICDMVYIAMIHSLNKVDTNIPIFSSWSLFLSHGKLAILRKPIIQIYNTFDSFTINDVVTLYWADVTLMTWKYLQSNCKFWKFKITHTLPGRY